MADVKIHVPSSKDSHLPRESHHSTKKYRLSPTLRENEKSSTKKKDSSVVTSFNISSSESDMTSSPEYGDIEIEEDKMELRRDLGFFSSVCMIVGTIVGSGIFVSPKGVLESTGSVALSLIVWIGAGVIALFGGLCYAELGTMIQKSGGEYSYLQAAYGNIMAFLFTWVSVLLIRTSSLAIMTLTMAEYVATFFSSCGDHEVAKKLIAIFACVTVGIVNSYSTKLAARVQNLTTTLKVGALVVILVGGIVQLFKGKTSNLNKGFEGSATSPSVIALAFYDALWAYDGWQNLNYITEEVKNPAKTLPRANIVAVLTVTLLYTLTNVSYLTAMTATELLDADAVAVLWGDRILKAAGVIIPICVIISTFGSSNGTAFTGSRTIFAAARDDNLPGVLSYIHVQQRTPLPSMLFCITIALFMVAAGDISSLIDFFSFVAWLSYGLTFASLLILRYTMKDVPRPYKVPIVIPILMTCVSVYLVIAPIVESPQIGFLYAFLFVMAGLIFYFPFVRFHLKIPGFEKLSIYIQLLLEVSPTSYKVD
ncbi:hypothetical protein V1264_000628 [Littorina saxatilis]